MKTTDCFWEKPNLGVSAVEITLGNDDTAEQFAASGYENYGYAVVKVPVGCPAWHGFLAQRGFVFAECQCLLSKQIDADVLALPKVAAVAGDIRFALVRTQSQLNHIKEQVAKGMFSTDRIALDPHFGLEVAARRYANWLQTDFDAARSQIHEVWLGLQHVGFMMTKTQGEVLHNVLNGLYPSYQRQGLGIITAAAPLLYGLRCATPPRFEATAISLNNMPVVRHYNYLNFTIDTLLYVFVKHQPQPSPQRAR